MIKYETKSEIHENLLDSRGHVIATTYVKTEWLTREEREEITKEGQFSVTTPKKFDPTTHIRVRKK